MAVSRIAGVVVLVSTMVLPCLGDVTGDGGSSGAARPRLVLPQPSYQAGKRVPGPPLEVRFPVRNEGDERLEIRDASPDCGCVVAAFDREVAPGQTGEVRATLRTEGMRGRIAKHIRLQTNDPERPEALLTVNVSLVPPISFDPGEEVAIPVEAGRLAVAEVTITCMGAAPLEVETMTASAPYVWGRVVSPPTPAALAASRGASTLTVALVVGPTAPAREFRETVTLRTNQEAFRELTLTVHGYPRGALLVTPPRLVFEGLQAQALVPVQRAATLYGATPFQIVRAVCDDPVLALEVIPDADGRSWEVRVSYRGGWQPGTRSGVIRFETDDPRRPVIELPYRAQVE